MIDEKAYKPTFKEIKKYLRNHHMTMNRENYKRAKTALKNHYTQRHSPEGKDVAVQETASDWQIIFGRCRVGGVITYAQSVPSAAAILLVVTLACHEISAVRKIFVDDEEVDFGTNDITYNWAIGKFANKVFCQTNKGNENQLALSALVADSGGYWTSNHRQRGCAHCYIQLRWDENLFPSGLPNLTFEVDGYLNSGYAYSNNPAYLLEAYLQDPKIGPHRNIEGTNLVLTSIDGATNEGWDICDELIPLANGGTETRYTANFSILASEGIGAIVEELLSACGGTYIDFGYSNWMTVLVPKWRPPVFEITLDDILEPFSISPVDSISNAYHILGGTYIDPNKNYEETDFPPYYFRPNLSNYYRSREDISLPATNSPTMAQRIAKIACLKDQFSLRCTLIVRVNFYKIAPGETVMVTIKQLDWIQKIFAVQSSQLIFKDDNQGNRILACQMELQETDSEIYDWTIADETGVGTMPTMDLPGSHTTGATNPTNLAAASGNGVSYIQPDGTTVTRVLLTWTAPTDPFVTSGGTIEVQAKKNGDANWSDFGIVSGSQTSIYLLGLQAGYNYDFRIRGSTTFNLKGDWVYLLNYSVQSITTPPSNVSDFIKTTSGGNVILTWNNVPEGNIAFYRIKKTTSGQPWEDCTLVAESLGQPVTADNTSTPTFKIKAVNTLGIESATATDAVAYSAPATGSPVGLLLSLTTP